MPTPASQPQAEWLIANLGWIRSLARALVGDAQTAEDLVQETCVVAMQGSPRGEESFRGWIRVVMRNLLGSRLRREDQRSGWEALASRVDEDRAADELVEKASMQSALVELVLGLDERYRTVVLLRYLEELPPREIARRLDVSVHTVKTRLGRALHQLREELVRTHREDRTAWFSSLCALALAAEPRALPLLGSAMLKVKVTAAAVVLAIAGIGTVTLLDDDADGPASARQPERVAAVSEPAAESAAPLPATQPSSGANARTAVAPAGAPEPVSAPPDPPASPWLVRGTVLDDRAEPLAGIRVVDRRTGAAAVSGTDGGFELAAFSSTGRLDADDPAWVTIGSGLFDTDSAVAPTVVVARRITVAGHVLNEASEPLSRVHVELHYPPDFDARFDVRPERVSRAGRRTQTDRLGTFELADFPAVRGAELYLLLAGYEPAALAVPDRDAVVTIVLERPRTNPSGTLRGHVLSADGVPLPEARVALGLVSVETDERGGFALDLARAATTERLVAAKPGYLPAALHRRDHGGDAWPPFVEVRLGGEPLSIRGRVVDEEGRGVGGAQVWVDDGSLLGVDGKTPLVLESYLAGGTIPVDPLGSRRELPDEDGVSNWSPWWSAPEPSAVWHWVTTDETGAFELSGLLERTYRLKVLDPATLLSATSAPIEAGADDARIELPRGRVHDVLEGRLVDDRGEPVPGARVSLFTRANTSDARVWGGTVRAVLTRGRDRVRTDERGLFRFERVPREGLELDVTGDDLVPTMVPVPAELPPGGFEVVVGVRRHFKLELEELADAVTGVEARDAAGGIVELWQVRGSYRSSQTEFPVIDGRSPVLSVTPEVAELLLVGPTGVVERRSVDDLERGTVNVLR